MRWPIALTLLATSQNIFSIDYLTIEQANKIMFAAAVSFQEKTIALTGEQLAGVAKLAQTAARSTQWKLQVALGKDDKPIGYIAVDNVVGKFELITFAVGVALDGTIQGVEILSYRESHGGEVRLPFWRKQFIGKTSANPLRVGEDIRLISGATMSCNSVTEGVRRIVAVITTMVPKA
jgi:Na+-translocating ferredoxin:NAD+ oxidoreductase RnfG subunit